MHVCHAHCIELLKVADDELAINMRCFEHDGAAIMHDNPLLCKFRYVESKGLKREWEQIERKELHGTGQIKSLAQFEGLSHS